MITAKEAYDKAEKKRNEVKEMEMQDIENSIEVASSNGFIATLLIIVSQMRQLKNLKQMVTK